MFGSFKRKKKEELKDIYHVDIDDVRTVAQLRESVKILMKCIGHPEITRFDISEDYLDQFPALSKIAYKDTDKNA